MIRPLHLLLVLTLLGPAIRAGETEKKLVGEVVEVLRWRFYDAPDYHGVDLADLRAQFEKKAADVEGLAASRTLIETMLRRFRASHLTLLEPEVYAGLRSELAGRPYRTFGLILEPQRSGGEDAWFVRSVSSGGSADRAGLRRGDRILRIDGVAPRASPHVIPAGTDPGLPGPALFAVRATDAALSFVVRRRDKPSIAKTVSVKPASWSGARALRASVKKIRRDGLLLGYVAVPSVHRGADEALETILTNQLGPCDGLVLDLRGRGGWANVAKNIVALFRGKVSRNVFARRRQPPLWIKPVVFLIDARTRSAKEIIAHELKNYRLGPLVGQRTEGAVLAAGFYRLSDGRVLEIPIASVPSLGVNLEGRGVAPDVKVDAPLPYAAGRDPILEAGWRTLSERVRAAGLAAEDHARTARD